MPGLPIVGDEDDDTRDPKAVLEARCAQKACAHLVRRLAECSARVASRPGTTETCAEELLDLSPCVDRCVARHLFKFLK